MKILGHELLESSDVPHDELWIAQPISSRPQQEVTADGGLRLTVVQKFKILGKIAGLTP